jgi:hypothetical protein
MDLSKILYCSLEGDGVFGADGVYFSFFSFSFSLFFCPSEGSTSYAYHHLTNYTHSLVQWWLLVLYRIAVYRVLL